MENLTPVYDNTLTEGFFNLNEHQSPMTDKEKNQLMQVLTNSLDLQELGSIVFAELKSRLNACFLNIVSPCGHFQFGKSQLAEKNPDAIVKSFDVKAHQDSEIKIEYGFLRNLSLREHQLLKDLNQCVRNPLRNALQFFQIQKLALKDSLTSLGNRLQFDEILAKSTSLAHRSGENVALIVMDLDKFKSVNDRFGHSEGDKVLMSVAGAISKSLRNSDHAFRFGGDEFCCITTNTCPNAVELIIERIQQAFADDSVLSKHNISCSFGLAMLKPNDTDSSFFQRADNALYHAKEDGRNCGKWAE